MATIFMLAVEGTFRLGITNRRMSAMFMLALRALPKVGPSMMGSQLLRMGGRGNREKQRPTSNRCCSSLIGLKWLCHNGQIPLNPREWACSDRECMVEICSRNILPQNHSHAEPGI